MSSSCGGAMVQRGICASASFEWNQTFHSSKESIIFFEERLVAAT